jgi:hypothetical protein
MKTETASRTSSVVFLMLLVLVVGIWYTIYHPSFDPLPAEHQAIANELKAKIAVDNCKPDNMTMFYSESMEQWLEICKNDDGWFARLSGKMANGSTKVIKAWKESTSYPIETFRTLVSRLNLQVISGPNLW